PTAVWYNPSGIALSADNVVYLGGELVFPQRSYTPDGMSPLGKVGVTGQLSESPKPTAIPVLGASTRFGFGKSPATRFAFAIGAYDAYGGSISYKPGDITVNGKLQ